MGRFFSLGLCNSFYLAPSTRRCCFLASWSWTVSFIPQLWTRFMGWLDDASLFLLHLGKWSSPRNYLYDCRHSSSLVLSANLGGILDNLAFWANQECLLLSFVHLLDISILWSRAYLICRRLFYIFLCMLVSAAARTQDWELAFDCCAMG